MTSAAGASFTVARIDDKPLLAGGCHDPVSARVIEQSGGFDALYVTGFGLAASRLGLPDMGFMDRSDFIDGLERIRRVTSLPMIVDAEEGYGDGAQIVWTFRELARIGVSAAHIEDLKDPLKYRDDVVASTGESVRSGSGLDEQEALYSVAEMRQRIAAAKEGSLGTVGVIARCDGKRYGVATVISRLNAYIEAGATACMVAEPYDLDELRQIAAGVDAPLLCCVGVRQDHAAHAYTYDELTGAGIAGGLFTATTFFAAVRAMLEVAQLIAAQRNLSIQDMQRTLAPFGEVNDLLGAGHWYSTSERLSSGGSS